MSDSKGYALDGNAAVESLKSLRITGNVIPHIWWERLRRESGNPHWLAIQILSDVVYWYRPVEVRDETTGQVLGHRKKFKADKLQRDYAQFANQYGVSKRQVKRATDFLEERGLIEKDFRNETIGGKHLSNVLYIGLDAGKLEQLTHGEASTPPDSRGTPSPQESEHPPTQGATPPSTNGETYTETTQETTQKESLAREAGADESNPSPTRTGQTDNGKGSAPKSNAEKEGEHWALVTFRRQMEHYKDGLDYCDVQAFAQDKITSTVTDRALWRKAIEKGLTRGWQHTSVDAFLDHYKREEEHKATDGGDGSASANAFVRGEDGLSPYERSRQQALERQAERSGEKISSGAGRL